MSRSRGPQEPAHVQLARAMYWQHRQWLITLENRIMDSGSGMEWLFRVKQIGFA